MSIPEFIWYGNGALSGITRTVLQPAEWVFRGVVGLRNAMYDRAMLRVHPSPLPAVSVGNLAVGGTGKTPVSAWLAGRLLEEGGNPALVMRGYGDDEPTVHALLTPAATVVVDADRVAGLRRARAASCDVAVLDDAFQHRRAARQEDVVLVSADRWREPVHLLPAGPWREPMGSLRRASLVVVTRKAATAGEATALARRLAPATRSGASATVRLSLGALHAATGDAAPLPLAALRGQRILAVSGIGDPRAFHAQLREAGADVVSLTYRDHHRYTTAEAAHMAERARDVDRVVCTLKDAVKLRSHWPRGAPPLWYVSLRCEPEDGAEALEGVVRRLLSARHLIVTGRAG